MGERKNEKWKMGNEKWKAAIIIHYSLAACGDFIIHSSLEKSRRKMNDE